MRKRSEQIQSESLSQKCSCHLLQYFGPNHIGKLVVISSHRERVRECVFMDFDCKYLVESSP